MTHLIGFLTYICINTDMYSKFPKYANMQE